MERKHSFNGSIAVLGFFIILAITAENLPIRWKVQITPSYITHLQKCALAEVRRKPLEQVIEEYGRLMRNWEPGNPWVYSELENRDLHIDYIRSELIRKESDLKDLRKSDPPSSRSWLSFLFRKWTGR